VLDEKIKSHARFWQGEGPCLILIPPPAEENGAAHDYAELFYQPEWMWDSQMRQAAAVPDWPTDGIPTVRPNLGVIFIPAIAGQRFEIRPGQMPWPGASLSRDEIRATLAVDIRQSPIMRLAVDFYRMHQRQHPPGIVAYHPDTQGIFDIAHLLYGDEIFPDLVDEHEAAWIDELMDICRQLYVRVSEYLKLLLDEPRSSMIHGHGTSQGVFFPHAGIRMSEDTPTLVSPATIERFILPVIECTAGQFGGAFMHYCGFHPGLFRQLCQLKPVRAIDLGNPEMYDLRWLFECCAQTGTIFCSRVAALAGENWEAYLRRIAGLLKQTGARCILRPLVYPNSKALCQEMLDLWHTLTD